MGNHMFAIRPDNMAIAIASHVGPIPDWNNCVQGLQGQSEIRRWSVIVMVGRA